MQPVGYYLQQSQAAVAYVKTRMTLGANNNADIFTSFFESRSCVPETRGSYQTEFWKALPAPERIKVAAIWAEHSGCGNCGEQSAIAYEWLRRCGVLPLEYMVFQAPKDHAFVVVGRDPGSVAAQPATWGPNAVVCDPWKNKAYLASALSQVWPGGIPKRFH
jgi:hypothetical protein